MNLGGQWVALRTMVKREILRFMRIWVQTIVPPVITTSLYFVIFGELIGSQIGDIDGFTYMEYIVPGLILMAVIQNAYANTVSSVYGSRFQRHIEEMAVSPMAPWVILTGFVVGGIARGLTVGAAVTGVSLFFTDLTVQHWGLSLTVVLLTSTLFAIGGFINGMYARNFDDISIIPTFVLTPLTYLGGIFYSIAMLPAFWQDVSRFNPILYMINGFRFGLLGHSDIDPALSLAITVVFIVALAAFSLHLLRIGRGIRS